MSRIDKLIERLCPDGVEYRSLGEVCELARGVRVIKKNLAEEGDIPVFQNALKPLGFNVESNRRGEMAFVICAGAAGQVGYSKVAFWAADDCYTVESALMNDRFLYHLLLNQQHKLLSQVRKASIPRLSRAAIEKLRIPVPPMEVQEEIVRVLDTLTELEAELEAKLEAELEARKAQFAYFRNKLISQTAATSSLQELKEFGVFTGSTPKKSEKHYFGDEFPFYKPGDFDHGKTALDTSDGLSALGLSAVKVVPGNSTMVVCIGATIGKVGFAPTQGACNQQINVIPPNESFDSRFVFHCISSQYCQDQIARLGNFSSMPILNLKNFAQILIPAPDLLEQQRIANTLDSFDILANDIFSGLPTEIEARRKQYAYYRDRLLAFKEKKA